MRRILFFASIFLLLCSTGAAAKLEVELVDLKINSREARAGGRLEISFSLSDADALPGGSFIFFHLEGLGPGRYLNADMS